MPPDARYCTYFILTSSKQLARFSLSLSHAHTRTDSSDIAFKPNDDGWGYTRSYASGWDRVFAKKGDDAPQPAAAEEAPPAATAKWPADDAARRAQVAALDAARDVGALSEALYAQARQELDGRS